MCFFFSKQKTAYEMRIRDWSSDVCSSDLVRATASPPLKASPAPVVSTTAPASIAGTCSENLPPCSRAPLSPSVTIPVPTPRSSRQSAARRASSPDVTFTPVRPSASDPLGLPYPPHGSTAAGSHADRPRLLCCVTPAHPPTPKPRR